MLTGDILVNNAKAFPHHIGIVDTDTRLTWDEVNRRVNSLSHALLSLGLRKPDRVALLGESCHQSAEFIFAVAKTGLIGVCLNYRWSPSQCANVINDCQARAIIVQNKFATIINSIRSAPKTTPILIGIGEGHGCPYDYEALLREHPSDEPRVDISEDDIHMVIYTTGTLGAPKPVPVTHRQRILKCIADCYDLRFLPGDVYLIDHPHYTAPGVVRLLGTAFQGHTAVLHTFSPQSACELIEREKVTMYSLIPLRYNMLRDYLKSSERKYDLSSLRQVLGGAGHVWTPEQFREMLDFFGVSLSIIQYGVTEAGGMVCYLTQEEVAAALSPKATEKQRQRLRSVGRPNPLECQIRVVDENDQDVPVGQTGEIILKGDLVMPGYWNQPELTKEVMRNGWYLTRDIGMLDEDGYLYWVGRKDNMIKSGGFNVFPEEIEAVIRRYPAVKDVSVFGIPDQKWGHAVTAAVCLKKGQSATEEEIKSYCRQHLAGYQVPKSVHFVEQLPVDRVYGKVLVKELQRIYSGVSLS